MSVWNDCETAFELDLVECVECDTSAYVEPASEDVEPVDDEDSASPRREPEAAVLIEGADWSQLEEGQTYRSHYTWTLDDQEGDLEADVTFNGDNSDACSQSMCSTAGESLPTDTIVLVALAFTLLLFRRIEQRPETSSGDSGLS